MIKEKKEIEIDSVVRYITEVDELLKQSKFNPKVHTVFFRGHADKLWDLKPSLLRNEGLIKNEDLMFRMTVAKYAPEFKMCTSTLDYLVKMQHYGLPTRLLDLTTNPLVALYFACEELQAYDNVKGKCGEVVVLKVPTLSIKHYDSDTVSILSNIAKCKEEEMDFCLYSDKWSDGNFFDALQLNDSSRKKFVHHIGKYYCKAAQSLSKEGNIEALKNILNSLSEFAQSNGLRNLSFYNTDGQLKTNDEIDTEIINLKLQPYEKGMLTKLHSALVQETKFSSVFENYVEWFNQIGQIQLLLHQISLEKSHFRPIINPHDLARVYVVNVRQDNQRIRNQMGAFVLFGLGLSNNNESLRLSKAGETQIPDVWNLSQSVKFIIPPKNKRGIIDELERLGISKSFVYPELEVFAKELGRQYRK